MKFRKRVLSAIARAACQRPALVIIVGLLLTVLSLMGVFRLHFETGLADYLPEDSAVVRLFTSAVEHYGTSQNLIIVLEGGAEDVEARKALADDLARRLEASDLVLSVDYRFGNDLAKPLHSPLLDYALFYLDDDGLDQLVHLLEPEVIAQRIKANKELMRSPVSLVAKSLVAQDPLGLSTLFAGKLREFKGNLKLRFQDGYPFSDDQKMLLMMVKPVEPPQNLPFTGRLLAEVKAMVGPARFKVEHEFGTDALAHVAVRLTGGYPIAADYNELLRRDLGWTILTAFVGVMLLFLLAFRRIGSLLYVGVPLLIGLSWTMGFAGYAVGSLNLFTAAAAAVLLGLAIDFAIHLFNRYVSERDLGQPIDEAIRRAVVETGDGVLTAALTSVAAFGACMIAGIKGLAQLGLICGAGMLLGLAANFFLMPALLKLRGGRKHREDFKDSSFNFGLESMSRVVVRHPVSVVVAWVLLSVIFGWGALRASIDTDMRSLRPAASQAVLLQRELTRAIGSGLTYSMILVKAPTEDAALEKNHLIANRLDELVKTGDVVFYLSLDKIFPSPGRQEQVLDWLRRKRRDHPEQLDPERIAADLARELKAEGFRLGPEYERTVAALRRALSVDRRLDTHDLDAPVLRRQASRFLWQEDGETELATYVYPRSDGAGGQYRIMNLLESRVMAGVEGAHLIGVRVLGRELKRLLQEGALEATALASLLVLSLLWIHFRRFRYVVLTAIPLLLGELGAIGGMSLLGIHLNMVNMGIVPIIIGIGIDDGIHIAHRFADRGESDVAGVFRFAGRAVVITSLTTIVGFGSLVFASYKGLWTAGVFAILGVGMCLLSSITLLPALLQIFVVRRTLRPEKEIAPAASVEARGAASGEGR
ncbi:MAG: RND family transporter [Acidobacteriota bacterium]